MKVLRKFGCSLQINQSINQSISQSINPLQPCSPFTTYLFKRWVLRYQIKWTRTLLNETRIQKQFREKPDLQSQINPQTRQLKRKQSWNQETWQSTINIHKVLRQKQPILHSTERLHDIFKETPVVAYRRSPNLRHLLVRAKPQKLGTTTQPNHSFGTFLLQL